MLSNISKELLAAVVVFAIGVMILTFAKDIRLKEEEPNLDDMPVDDEEEEDVVQSTPTGVGQSEPSEILKGVKAGSMITYPESTRSIADSLYGVNHAEGICGRDTASNLDAALSRAKEGWSKQDCRVKKYTNMSSLLESAILGKAKMH